jgi:hypothetical protein
MRAVELGLASSERRKRFQCDFLTTAEGPGPCMTHKGRPGIDLGNDNRIRGQGRQRA